MKPEEEENQGEGEDQRGGGVSEHFRAKEQEEMPDEGHWNHYHRDDD